MFVYGLNEVTFLFKAKYLKKESHNIDVEKLVILLWCSKS